eukprot:CAMPEP_0185772564 /NCGR_PEP_ID=MMETSP1174-20130828/69643_1 /TAXON_ID=35687 /ORGANISM="Dictyocha speculum, Strain CCMP1381" /LENGTH=375 /DNA_ID=CAMNT_0028458905 /DNA_START=84 /DNA_END=1211 /DNA_ORIENTATION=+
MENQNQNQYDEDNEIENSSLDPLNPPAKKEVTVAEATKALCSCISDKALEKWADVIILGPLPASIYAVVIACGGEIILSSAATTCQLNGIDAPEITYVTYSITAAIYICQFFLLHFAWTFLGFRVEFSRSFFRRKGRLGFISMFFDVCKPANKTSDPWVKTSDSICLLAPYQSLSFVAFIYVVLTIMAVAVMGFGSFAASVASAICAQQTPVVISFAWFMVITFWIFFFLAIFGLFVRACGKRIARKMKQTVKAAKSSAYPTEDRMVVSEFKKLDRDGTDTMDSDELKTLLANLQLDMSDEEVEKVKKEIDDDASGSISLQEFLKWYHSEDNDEEQSGEDEHSGEDSEEEGSDDDDEEEESDEDEESGKGASGKK